MSLGCCVLDSLDEGPNVLYAFIELNRGRLSLDLITECIDASHEDSVDADWHGVSIVRVEAVKAFYIFHEFACMLFN